VPSIAEEQHATHAVAKTASARNTLLGQVLPFRLPFDLPQGPIDKSKLLTSASLFLVGLMLQGADRPATFIPGFKTLIPVDWKVYARIGLGILSVNQFNQALNWQPPAWLRGIQAVGTITPMMQKFSMNTLAQVALLSPLVAGEIKLINWLNNHTGPALEEKAKVPKIVTSMGWMLAFTVAGFVIYPKFWAFLVEQKFLNPNAQTELLAAAGMATICPRGCSPGSVICLSEAAEFLGGLGKKLFHSSKPSETPPLAHTSTPPAKG
jgi:hypothetical protein